MDGEAWWAAVHGVAKSRTQLSDFPFTFHFPASEKEIAIHSSVLAWRIPGTGGAWGAAVYGVAQSRTRLKRFSSSSSILYSYRSTLHNTVFSEKSKCENYVILAFWEEKCRVVLACTYIAYFWKDKQETDFLNGCFQLPKIELSCDMYIIFTCFVH